MMQYADYFLDIVIVDATYKRNRFNLPLVNVIGVNNFGHNIMLAFGLFSNETLDSYTWFFGELKKAWRGKNPLNFVIDGSETMKKGKILMKHCLIIHRYYSKFQIKNCIMRLAYTKKFCF